MMAVFRPVFSSINLSLRIFKNLSKPSNYVMVCVVPVRKLSSLEVSKNITLISNESRGRLANFKVEMSQDRPLVVILSWLLAKRKHVMKYADFYLARGFDVMNVNITPWQLLWPLKGTQLVASDLLRFLDTNGSYRPLVIHGFSVGGYLWSEALVQLAADQKRYQHILDRIIGQVWDSLADITEIPMGFPVAVFPRNKVLQSTLRQYIIYHLKTFDKVATRHYVRASQMFHTNIVRAPALFLISKSDPIGNEKSNLRAKENWDNMGIQTYWKCWDKSPHVGHFHHHPEEYKAELAKFMENIGVVQENIKVSSSKSKQPKEKVKENYRHVMNRNVRPTKFKNQTEAYVKTNLFSINVEKKKSEE